MIGAAVILIMVCVMIISIVLWDIDSRKDRERFEPRKDAIPEITLSLSTKSVEMETVEIPDLETELELAVEREDYERAAAIRDELKTNKK